jgi:glycosyltransferase involved in cell wall biosynthesis
MLKRTVILLLRTLLALVKLAWISRTGRPDLVYTNTVVHPIGPIYAAICHVPHIWHIHEPVADYGWKFLLGQNKSVNFLFRFSHTVVFNSLYTRQCYSHGRGIENTVVVYNGIAGPMGATADLRHGRRSLSRIGVIGELCSRKGQDLVLEAMALEPAMEGLEVFFGGEGSAAFTRGLAEKARQLPAVSLHMLGLVETWNFLSKVDLLIVPSRTEAFGRVVVEGMLAGIPVLAASTGGITEIIEDGRTGFLFESGSAASLREKLVFILGHANIEELAATAQTTATDEFSLERYIAEMLDVIGTALRGKESVGSQ